jgi:hypothetical protein
MSQLALSIGLLKSGSLFLATGFFWGIFIPKTPYPRIALSVHMNMIQHGLLSIAAGTILYQHGLVELSPWQIYMIGFPHYYLWLSDFVTLCNCWWGTNKGLKLVTLPLYEVWLMVLVGERVWSDGGENLAGDTY